MSSSMYAFIPHIIEKLTSQDVIDNANLHGFKKWLDKFWQETCHQGPLNTKMPLKPQEVLENGKVFC